jgi:MFS transporter, DHA2 family, multidrug resistance protein
MNAPTLPKATRREWIGLLVIALPCILYSMDLTVLHLAVPALTRDLRPSSAELLWIIDIYGFLVAGSLITMGTLGDRIGRRRLLLVGAAAFGAVSIVAAFCPSAATLIAARALLGLAGATVAPSTLSLIRSMFLDPAQRTFAVGVWITSYSLGAAIGPVVGGALLAHFWWGSVFLIGVPVMLVLLVLGPIFLPEYKDPNPGRPDVWSAALSLASVLAVVFGLKRLAQDGATPLALLSIVLGVLVGVAFVRRQQQLTDPLLDLRLFRVPAFSASLFTYGFAFFVLFGGFLFLPQYLQLVRGLGPFEAGLWDLPWALSFIVGALVTPALSRKIAGSRLMSSGLVLAACGFLLFTQLGSTTAFWSFALGSSAFALGFAPVFTLTTDLIVGSAPSERAGAAAALSETGSELGAALGIAIFGSLGVTVYRHAIQPALSVPLPQVARDAAAGTLGGASAAAAELPHAAGSALLGAAQAAFTEGVRACSAASAAGALALAVFVAFKLRKARA